MQQKPYASVHDTRIKVAKLYQTKDKFTMVIDMTDFTVKQCSRPQDMYSAHVLGKIVELYERTGNIPKEIKSVWF